MPDPRRIDTPSEGYFVIRLVKGGPPVAARIAFDEATGMWQVTINGEPKRPAAEPWHAESMEKVWAYALMTTEAEYNFLLARAAHAREHDPTHPAANPDEPIDFLAMKPIF